MLVVRHVADIALPVVIAPLIVHSLFIVPGVHTTIRRGDGDLFTKDRKVSNTTARDKSTKTKEKR